MSFAYPGLTHCEKCFSLLNMSGRCESCDRRKKENEMIKKQIENAEEEAKEYLNENEKGGVNMIALGLTHCRNCLTPLNENGKCGFCESQKEFNKIMETQKEKYLSENEKETYKKICKYDEEPKEVVLDLIDVIIKKNKEIEELKVIESLYKILLKDMEDIQDKNFISKSKIKNKLNIREEELEESKDSIEANLILREIYILKELLEEG